MNRMMNRLCLLSLLVLLDGLAGYAQSWQQSQKITASDRTASTKFSKSVDLSGSTIAVGAHRVSTDANGQNPLSRSGAAYFYYRDASGQWGNIQKVVSSDRQEQDNFGTSLAVSDNWAIIGAYKRDEPDQMGQLLYQCGAAYLFEKDSRGIWQEKQKLIAPDKDSLNYFGISVDIDRDIAVVGACYRAYEDDRGNSTPQAGAVYVFQRDAGGQWSMIQEITPPEPEKFALFGWSVALSGDDIVVGAYKEDNGDSTHPKRRDAGAAYVFHRSSDGQWTFAAKLLASDRNQDSWFGWDVAIRHSLILVGAPQDNAGLGGQESKTLSGSVYLFTKEDHRGWVEFQKLKADDAHEGASFGYAVDASETSALIGARWEDYDADQTRPLHRAGAAYYYLPDANGTWQMVQKITPEERHTNDWFGFSLALEGTTCVVGSFSDDYDPYGNNILNDAGAAYIFDRAVSTSLRPTVAKASTPRITPNPTRGYLSIQGAPRAAYTFSLWDMNGSLILQTTPREGEHLNLSSMPKGVYLLRWEDDSGYNGYEKILLSP